MCAKAPKNWACRWKSTSASASPLCASTPTHSACADRSKIYCDEWSELPVRVQHERRAEQHAGDHQSDHGSGKPSGKKSRTKERCFGFRALLIRRDGRGRFRLQRLGYKRPVKVIYFGDEAVALARNRIHERRLLRRIAEDLPQLVHGGVHVGIVVDVRVRRPELQAQLFAGHDVTRLLQQSNERVINLALELNPRPILKKFFFF